ncbi:MAG: tetratricopeptide repeat protein [Candidatus Dormibacteria bacterium]
MAVEGRARKTGSSLAQGIADLTQSWVHLAREMAPQVPELPAVLEQEVSTLHAGEITEDRLNQVARVIVKRVSDAGFPDQAGALQRRMGRAMYELLLLIATEEELRSMGMLLEAAAPIVPLGTVAPTPTPPAATPHSLPVQPVAAVPSTASPARPAAPGPRPNPQPAAVAAAPLAPLARPVVAIPPGTSVAPLARPGGAVPPGTPAAPVGTPLPPQPAAPAVPRPVQAAGSTTPAQPPAAAGQQRPPAPAPTNSSSPPADPPEPAPQAEPPMFTRVELPAAVAQTDSIKPPAVAQDEDAALWGFNPAERESVDETPPAEAVAEEGGPDQEPALAVESRPAGTDIAPPPIRPAGGSVHGWTVRLSPKAARERERRLRQRLSELPPLLEEIVVQVHEQRRAVSDRGAARQAVREAAEQSAPGDLGSAAQRLAQLIDAHQLTDAAALVLRVTEAFPGETSADMACRVGEAARHAKDDELAILCFTTAVLAAPPVEPACWQLAGIALERKDPRLAPIWMEFLARLLRARGADEDAVVVYRQLLNLTPRREDVRDILRVSSLTGVLPD